jgi:pimeloyl-ACP methyl ester carboxylesterase
MMAFSAQTLEVAGCRITLRRAGRGRQLLYLHGAAGGAVLPFLEELAQDFEVLAPEHPGFGDSDEPAWLDNIHDLAYFYLSLMEKLGVRDAVLLGASIGGWLALEIAVRNATRIAALSVVGPSGIHVDGLKKGDPFMWVGEDKVRKLFVDQDVAARVLAQPVDADVMLKNQFTVAKLAWEPRLFDPHLAKWLHRIDVPTQIVWGENDQVLPAGYAHAYARLIPRSRVDIVPRCGHLPHVEKPAEFLRAFRDFTRIFV